MYARKARYTFLGFESPNFGFEIGNVTARLLAAFRMHSLNIFGKSDCTMSQMIRRPYIPGLLDSQPQPAPAPEPRRGRSMSAQFILFFSSFFSLFSYHFRAQPPRRGYVVVGRMADVATESHDGDFHENRSRAWPVRSIHRRIDQCRRGPRR